MIDVINTVFNLHQSICSMIDVNLSSSSEEICEELTDPEEGSVTVSVDGVSYKQTLSMHNNGNY